MKMIQFEEFMEAHIISLTYGVTQVMRVAQS